MLSVNPPTQSSGTPHLHGYHLIQSVWPETVAHREAAPYPHNASPPPCLILPLPTRILTHPESVLILPNICATWTCVGLVPIKKCMSVCLPRERAPSWGRVGGPFCYAAWNTPGAPPDHLLLPATYLEVRNSITALVEQLPQRAGGHFALHWIRSMPARVSLPTSAVYAHDRICEYAYVDLPTCRVQV